MARIVQLSKKKLNLNEFVTKFKAEDRVTSPYLQLLDVVVHGFQSGKVASRFIDQPVIEGGQQGEEANADQQDENVESNCNHGSFWGKEGR